MKLGTPLTDTWRTIVPASEDPHGPLPPLLLALTVVTGLVDAFSYLVLGRVFVANMTGNVVFLTLLAKLVVVYVGGLGPLSGVDG